MKVVVLDKAGADTCPEIPKPASGVPAVGGGSRGHAMRHLGVSRRLGKVRGPGPPTSSPGRFTLDWMTFWGDNFENAMFCDKGEIEAQVYWNAGTVRRMSEGLLQDLPSEARDAR